MTERQHDETSMKLPVEPNIVFDWQALSERELRAWIAPGWLVEVHQSLSDDSWSFRVNNSGRCALASKDEAIRQAEECARTRVSEAVDSARKVFETFGLYPAPKPGVVTDAMIHVFKKAFHEDAPSSVVGDYDAHLRFALGATAFHIEGHRTLTAEDLSVLELAVSRLPDEWQPEGSALLAKSRNMLVD